MQTIPGCVCSSCLPDAGGVEGLRFLPPISVASVSFVILILRKAIGSLGLEPEGLHLTTDPLTLKAMTVLSYYMTMTFRLGVRRQEGGGEVACPTL